MKTLRNLLIGAILLTVCIPQHAQSNDFQGRHYVVIGAFAIKKNAVRFATSAAANNLQAKFELNPARQLYYVYVLTTDDRAEAIDLALRLRSESAYNDTWVFKGILGEANAVAFGGVDINPITQENVNRVVSNDVALTASNENAAAGRQVTFEEVSLPEDRSTGLSVHDELSGRNFFFKVLRADTRETIAGDVNVIDNERLKKMGTYAANRQVRITNPNNRSGNLSLIAEVFGYRKIQREINYTNPEGEDIITDSENNVVVPFELVRLQKGDIAVMYNVYFFKDAAVMRPESRWEVSSLLDMLKENPKYKIKIHGHTNGSAPGKIVSMDEKSDNFFSLANTHEGFGSAKKLSQERAEVIKAYLIANGIESGRMQVKAWGGKKPVVDKLHSLAENNVRVEIEILDH